jgi:RHS repeat-associated protein
VTSATESVWNPFRYTGREWDSETGIYYYRARYYDQQVGRFWSEDPIQWGAGPNAYRYTRNQPNNLVDPTGLLEVYIWRYTGTKENWGHAAIRLENGTYISWWPGPDNFSGGSKIFESDAFEPSYARDVQLEQAPPDVVIRLTNLDEAAIQRWWDDFQKKTKKWKTVRQNCSTTAAQALKAGGANKRVQGFFEPNLIWTPEDVRQFAEAIQKAGSGVYTIFHVTK